MFGIDPNRREALQRIALLGAAGLVTNILPLRSALAADLTSGFVYIGPREDWGWNQSFATAAEALKGIPNVRVVQAGYLPESTNYGSGKDDAETRAYTKAMEGLIANGAGLVFSTAFDNDPFLLAMAKKYPKIVFRQATAHAESSFPPNVGSQNALIDQGHYVNGVAAGLCTTTNKLGFVAGFPFGPVLLNVNSFLLGSRQTNPKATVQVIFTGGWEDETHDAAATNALVDAGCDVITCHLDAPQVVIETAEKRGVKTCGHAFDQAPLAPKGYITGADYNWTDMFDKFIETLQKGGTLPNFVIGGYDKDYVRSSPFGAGATPEAINAATTAIQA
ncbi:MAG TPA: BMP family ABC transporter substrate-binding protein, partial [Pseudolabrys sp.]